VLLALGAELAIADKLAAAIADRRDPARYSHAGGPTIFHLCTDPAFKVACGRLPDGGADLCSQPTVSRRENMPTLQEIIRLGHRSASSNSLPASSKPPREFVSPSPPRVGMPHCSGSLPPQSFPQRPDTRGHDRPGRAHPQNPERVAKSPPKSR
jgi:hypothetical protein